MFEHVFFFIIPSKYTCLRLGKVQALSVAVRQQTLLAHLTAEPTVLEAREVSAKVGPLRLVDEDTASLQSPSDLLGPSQVLGVHRRTETSVGQVGTLDNVVFVGPGHDGKDRT